MRPRPRTPPCCRSDSTWCTSASGPDGHTASLVPGDPVLEVTDALVAVTQPYQGHRRMTLTYPALTRADQLLWLVTGDDKQDAAGQAAGRGRVHPGRPGAGHAARWCSPTIGAGG